MNRFKVILGIFFPCVLSPHLFFYDESLSAKVHNLQKQFFFFLPHRNISEIKTSTERQMCEAEDESASS